MCDMLVNVYCSVSPSMYSMSPWKPNEVTSREEAFTVSLKVRTSISEVKLTLKLSNIGRRISSFTAAACNPFSLLILVNGFPKMSFTVPSSMEMYVLLISVASMYSRFNSSRSSFEIYILCLVMSWFQLNDDKERV